jgi:hypothetical protein
MFAGDTFVHMDGSDPHLWIVISDPASHPDAEIVAVNVTSRPVCADTSCVLEPKDHSDFLQHTSYVNYADAVTMIPSVARGKFKGGQLKKRAPVSHGVLKKIRQGARFSADSLFISLAYTATIRLSSIL